MSSQKKCTACDNELHRSSFPKTQWKKGQDRICWKCIEDNQHLKKERRVEGNKPSKKKTSMEEGILSDVVFVYTGKGYLPKNVVLVHFDSSVVRISKSAFSNCNLLKEVVLNEGLKSISKSAFSGCNSLRSVTLPTTIVDIGSNAFASCTSLREVVLNEGLKSIGHNAFSRCNSLQSIALPTTIVDVGRVLMHSAIAMN